MTRLFKPFSSLFPEIRQCIIDEMEPTDRVRFTRCSKRSAKEAKNSKNYIYGLEIRGHSKKYMVIKIAYDKTKKDHRMIGCIMRFEEMSGIKFKTCLNSKFEELWKEELGESTNLVQFVGEQFKSLLKTYQNRIKKVAFEGNLFIDYDFEIDSMNRLEHLEMAGSMDFVYFFSKLRSPLNNLYIQEGGNNQKLASFEEVYQIEDTIFSPKQTFSYEQLLRITAPRYSIHIGNLTVNNIASIIRSWKNETPARPIFRYLWYLHNSNSDVSELLRLLGLAHDGYENDFCIKIKHNHEVGKLANLRYLNYSIHNELIFDICQQNPRNQ